MSEIIERIPLIHPAVASETFDSMFFPNNSANMQCKTLKPLVLLTLMSKALFIY